MNRSPITTHVLDTAKGKPAAGLEVALEFRDSGGWTMLGRGTTDRDGRVADLLAPEYPLMTGTYRLTFATGDWQKGFYPEVCVTFAVTAGEHYHVPLLVSPFGYTTYRGS